MTDHAEALAKALEPGELSDERIKELAEAFQTHATRFAHDEICPERDLVSALAELAAYRSRPTAEVVVTKLMADPFDDRDGPWFTQADCKKLTALPAGTKLYATPAPVAGTEPAGEVVEPDLAQQVLDFFKAARDQDLYIGAGRDGRLPDTEDAQYGPLAKALLANAHRIRSALSRRRRERWLT